MRHVPRLLALTAFAAACVVVYRDIVPALVHDWWTDGNYSHGFAIVPLAGFFALQRRDELSGAMRRPSAAGILLVLAAMVMLAAGVLGAELFLSRVSLIVLVAGAILFLYGAEHLRLLAGSLAFLLLMVPIPTILFNQIAFPLQLLASRSAEFALSIAGVPALREGNVILLPHTALEIVDACSGLRSLVSLLVLAIVYGYFMHRSPMARLALALAVVPIAIVANAVRIAGTGIAAARWGTGAAEGFFHGFSGWLLFMSAFVLLVAFSAALQRMPRWFSRSGRS